MKAGLILGLWILVLGASGCGRSAPPTPTITPQPTLSLADTSARDFSVTDFAAVHQPVGGDPNQYLIFGNIPIAKAPADLAPELAACLGRWEGYGNFAPVRKDRKLVLAIAQISALGGKLYAYSGTSLQFPDLIVEIDFRVVSGPPPALQFRMKLPDGSSPTFTLTCDPAGEKLVGWAQNPSSGPYELTRERNFYVYQDYPAYLASLGIHAIEYRDPDLTQYGRGYLLYLPESYAADPQKTWPLIYFLHGAGDVGDNLYLLAKASPFMYIREHGPLPAILVAPLLKDSPAFWGFPEAYMDGVLNEARAAYRIDPQRIYLTGLSLGGEATWRFALHQPETFAAIAPLSAYLSGATPERMKPIRSLPVWAIHGAQDTVVPLVMGRQPVGALQEAGGDVKFDVLPDHDHDTWTDTYSAPGFYEWLFQHVKP